MTELHGRRVLVTGASSGIGQACAEAFAAAGAELIVCGRRRTRLAELASRLQDHHGAPVTVLELDVRDADAVAATLQPLGAVDVLVNNAGLSRGLDPIQAGQLQDWEEMLDTNVKGLLYVSRALLPGMVERGCGHLINIGSIAGREVYPRGNVYCATKHAVDALTKGMRLDLVGTGVKVSTVDPGLVETEFSMVRFRGDRERAASVYQGLTPLRAADIAQVVLWVAARPAHVNVAEVLVLPTDQASSTTVHRSSS